MLEWATDFFKEKSVPSPRFSIEWLLADVLSVRRLDLYLKYDRPLSSDELAKLKPFVKRRSAHEPLQYITGETDFHNVLIKVQPGVLIPRQETEQMVNWILKKHSSDKKLTVLDIGTGSGCIPIAIKKARPEWRVFATDISEKALNIARKNAALNDTDIEFAKDDLFNPTAFLDEHFDLIISNPPYILPEEKDSLDNEVKNYEPELALFCDSIEKIYQAIAHLSDQLLAPGGGVYLELHEQHAPESANAFNPAKWSSVIKKDYDQKNRFLIANKD
jgi:release factor glutamine methyltransferase